MSPFTKGILLRLLNIMEWFIAWEGPAPQTIEQMTALRESLKEKTDQVRDDLNAAV